MCPYARMHTYGRAPSPAHNTCVCLWTPSLIVLVACTWHFPVMRVCTGLRAHTCVYGNCQPAYLSALLAKGDYGTSSLHPQCCTWHSVLEQGCPGSRKGMETGCLRHLRKKWRLHSRWREDLGGWGALQARETHKRARVLCWPVPRSHRHQVQAGGDHSNPWWGSKRHRAHFTSRQRLLSRCPVTETPIFGGGVHWGTLYNCELSNFHFQRHIHHQYSSPKRTIQTQPTS